MSRKSSEISEPGQRASDADFWLGRLTRKSDPEV